VSRRSPLSNVTLTAFGVSSATDLKLFSFAIGYFLQNGEYECIRDLSANRLFWNLPSHRKYQRRILSVILIAETERQRLWRARGVILAKIWLVEVFEQIDWSGVGTKEP
jgi:hypothetical protein